MSEPRPVAPAPVALVTGAARRIGAAIARRLHEDGYDLALHYRSSTGEIEALAAEFEATRPGSAFVMQADLGEFDRIPELVAHTIGRFGRLDALVNNASNFFPTPFGITTPGEPNISSTRWRTVADHKRRLYFFESALTPNTFWVDLTKVDFGGKVLKLDLGRDQRNTFAGDALGHFVPSAPFTFLGVDG